MEKVEIENLLWCVSVEKTSSPFSFVCVPIARLLFFIPENIQVAILLCNIELIFETALNRKSCTPPAVGCSVSNDMSFYVIVSLVHIVPI